LLITIAPEEPCIIFLFHLISIGSAAFKSHDLLRLIKKDPYVLSSIQIQNAGYYQQYKIPWYYPLFGGLLNGILFFSLGRMVYALKDWEEPSD
jgi:hypothetical protein